MVMTSGRFRYLLAGWAIVETMLFGGIINGWASLVFVLKEDGLYSDLCVPDPASLNATADNVTAETPLLQQTDDVLVSCKAQDGKLNLWFTIAAALRNVISIVVGVHIFKCGTRSVRLTGWFLFGTGALMMAFADESNPWLVLPALLTLTYGGTTLLLTNVQIATFFPQTAGVIVTLMVGAVDFSTVTQMAVKVLHESSLVSRLYSYVGLAGLHFVMVLISSLCFLPKDILTSQTDDNTSQPPQTSDENRRNSLHDWSENNVHSDHQNPKCLVCEDNTFDGGPKEHLAMNLSIDFRSEIRDDLTKTYLKGNQQSSEDDLTTLNMDHVKDRPDNNDVPNSSSSTSNLVITAPQTHTSANGFPSVSENNGDNASLNIRISDFHNVVHDLHTEDDLSTTALNGLDVSSRRESHKRKDVKEKASVTAEEEMFPTLQSCLRSPLYWLQVMWGTFNVFRLVTFFGFINTKLTAMFDGDKEKVSYFTNIQAYCTVGIMLVCWISGAVYDWQISLCKERKTTFERQVLPGGLPLTMTSLVGVAISVFWMVENEAALYVFFVLLVFYNTFTFGVAFSFIYKVFPERFFGILNGVMFITVGSFCFLQYAIFIWHDAYPGAPLHADIFMLILVVLSLSLPLYIVVKAMIYARATR